jgi:hypothetical protein
MAKLRWTAYEAIQTYLDTDLNSLANDANKLGGVIDNSTDRHFYMDVEVYLNTVDLSAQTNPTIDIFMLVSLDGTNYADGADGTDPTTQTLVKSVAVFETNTTHRQVTRGIIIPPGLFKLLIENKTGQTLNATLNTIKYRTYSEESA